MFPGGVGRGAKGDAKACCDDPSRWATTTAPGWATSTAPTNTTNPETATAARTPQRLDDRFSATGGHSAATSA